MLRVRRIASVEDDERHAVADEGIISPADAPAVRRAGVELFLREAVEVMVARHMVARPVELRELRLDALERGKRPVTPVRQVLEVAEFNHEVLCSLVEILHRRRQLWKRVAVVPCGRPRPRRVYVGVVQVGHQSEPDKRRFGTVLRPERPRGGKRARHRQEFSPRHSFAACGSTTFVT